MGNDTVLNLLHAHKCKDGRCSTGSEPKTMQLWPYPAGKIDDFFLAGFPWTSVDDPKWAGCSLQKRHLTVGRVIRDRWVGEVTSDRPDG